MNNPGWIVVALMAALISTPVRADVVDDQLDTLRSEIDALLLPTGLPVEEVAGVDEKLVELAEESGRLSRSSIQPRQKLVANTIELRAYHALANDAAQRDDEEQVELRLTQMRSAAQQTRELDAPAAGATGAFWLLTADLIEVNQSDDDLVARQTRAMARLEAFLTETEGREDDAEAARLVMEVKLGLLQLTTQAGPSRRACALLEELETLDDPRVDDARAICALIGEPADLSGVFMNEEAALTRGPTLLVFVPSADTQVLARSAPRDAPVRELVIDWSAQVKPALVAQKFAIRSLPWYVLIDADEKIVAIGQTAAILEQIPASPTHDKPAPVPTTANDAPQPDASTP